VPSLFIAQYKPAQGTFFCVGFGSAQPTQKKPIQKKQYEEDKAEGDASRVFGKNIETSPQSAEEISLSVVEGSSLGMNELEDMLG
jgi:hypothetical protein